MNEEEKAAFDDLKLKVAILDERTQVLQKAVDRLGNLSANLKTLSILAGVFALARA